MLGGNSRGVPLYVGGGFTEKWNEYYQLIATLSIFFFRYANLPPLKTITLSLIFGFISGIIKR